MALCSDCFKDGNHEGHDYNIFKSQDGGSCDCGDSLIMRESGFCSQHHGRTNPISGMELNGRTYVVRVSHGGGNHVKILDTTTGKWETGEFVCISRSKSSQEFYILLQLR